MHIVFLGPPGAGKGTYTSRMSHEYGLVHVSTGDLFREQIQGNTKLGKLAQSYMNKGQLVPDTVVIDMLKDRLEKPDTKRGCIFDGFPRTIPQAEALEKIAHIDVVLNFVADDAVLVKRLSNRRMGSDGKIYNLVTLPPPKGMKLTQRDDDKPEAIQKRLKVYHEQTKPLIEFYTKKGILENIGANSSNIDGIVDKVRAVIDLIKKRSA